MTRWEVLRELLAATRDPARIGDVPALKSELGGTRASAAIEAQMRDVRGYYPELDLEALGALPESTFGHQYCRFLQDNGLSPIAVTGNLAPDLLERNAFVVRYGIIHDMVHVLTGFDASWPGEVGVWSFVGAQNYSFTFRITAILALCAALFRSPLRLGEAWRAFERGRALGEGAPPLITLRLEEHLERDLSEVRDELGLAGAALG